MAHIQVWVNVSTHSRAEAAALAIGTPKYQFLVSTHSRAEAAALILLWFRDNGKVSTHSRAEAAAKKAIPALTTLSQFQHTAARRRLLPT